MQRKVIDQDTLVKLPDIAKYSLRDLDQNLTGLVKSVVQANLRASQELLRVTTRGEFLELQQRFVREYLIALMLGSVRLTSIIQQTADQVAHPRSDV